MTDHTADALLKFPKEKDRSGKVMEVPGGWGFWKYRPGANPLDFTKHDASAMTAFTGRLERNENVVCLKDAVDYWRNEGQHEGFSFIDLTYQSERYYPNLVKVFHANDEAAPQDATHRIFVRDGTTERAFAAYCKVEKASDPSKFRLVVPKADTVKAETTPLEVWTGAAYETKTMTEMENFIREQDAGRGKSNVARCVVGMFRGGKHTLNYSNDGQNVSLRHASRGKRGDSGTTTVFFAELRDRIRLVGFGYHTGNADYKVTWSEPKIVGGAVQPGLAMSGSIELG